MDIEKIRKRRAIKVVITDIIMATSVVIISIILVAVVTGWRINKDFTIEQNGLVSIRTNPTGVSVIIDDEKQSQTTNMTKMLRGGEHKITLKKDGYDSWEKTVKITPGWLLRLEYPRLFKQNRETETVETLNGLKFFHVSPDHSTALYTTNDSTKWQVMTNFNSTPKTEEVDLTDIFSDTRNGNFPYSIKSIKWSRDNERVLLNVTNGKTDEWGIIDLKNSKNSFNLSTIYNQKISVAEFEGGSNNRIIMILGGKLVRSDLSSKTLIEPSIENVSSFFSNGSEIIYLSRDSSNIETLWLTKFGSERATKIVELKNGDSTTFALTHFNGSNYLAYTLNNHLYVYQNSIYPTEEDDITNMKLIVDSDIEISPSEVFVSNNNEFIIFKDNQKIVLFDTELEIYHTYDYGSNKVKFLDGSILYRVDNESKSFIAFDFDNTNTRTILNDHAIDGFDALISNNNRYFYYVGTFETTSSKNELRLVREKL